jgi:hypothetical protein
MKIPETHPSPPNLSPLSAVALSFLIRAPKRDHDEWLVRGRSGEPGVVPVQVDPTGGRSLILGTEPLPLPLCEGAARIGAPSQRASRRRGCSHRPAHSLALAPQLPPRSVTGGGSAAKVAQPRMETPKTPIALARLCLTNCGLPAPGWSLANAAYQRRCRMIRVAAEDEVCLFPFLLSPPTVSPRRRPGSILMMRHNVGGCCEASGWIP